MITDKGYVTDKEWNAERRAMEVLDTSVIGVHTLVRDTEGSALGYTSKNGIIHVARHHGLYNQVTPAEARVMRMGVNVHEAMHQVFTDFDALEVVMEQANAVYQHFLQTIVNLIEDPAIENFAHQVVGGTALESLYFTIDKCYDLAAPISDRAGVQLSDRQIPWYEYTNALVQFGDGGALKGDFTSAIAKRCFRKTISKVYQAINEPNGAKRILLAFDVYQTAVSILPAIGTTDMRDILQCTAKKTGKAATNGSGEGKQAEKEEDDRNRKRLQTIKKIEEESTEELKKDAAKASDTSKASGKSTPESSDKNAQKTEKAKGKTQSTDTVPDSADGQDQSESTELSQGTSSPLGSQDEQSPGENKNTDDENTGDPRKDKSEQTEEQHQSDAETQKRYADDLVDRVSKMIENSMSESQSMDAENDAGRMTAADTVAEEYPQFSDVRVVDLIPENNNPEAYQKLQHAASCVTDPLINQLKKIFMDDRDQRVYTQSGKISVKRLASGRITTRIFEKKRLPGDKADMCLMLLVDCSGSMRGDKASQALLTLCALAETMSFFHIPTYCMGFHMGEGGYVEQSHFIRWTNSVEERESLTSLSTSSNNFDSYSIRYATELLKKRKEKHKLMNIISDGLPSACFPQKQGIEQNRLAIQDAREQKIQVFGTAIGTQGDREFIQMYGQDFFLRVKDPHQLTEQTTEMMKRIVKGW